MKISEVSINDLKQYANVFHSDDDNLFDTILTASKMYISTYTGLPLNRDNNTPVVNPISPGTSTITGMSTSGFTINVTLPDNTVLTVTVQSDGSWSVGLPVGKTLNKGDIVNATQTNLTGNVSAATSVIVGISQNPIPNCVDDFEDLTIALQVLSNEMYDNRDFTTDNIKVNFVVKQILDSHSVNYL